MGKVNLLLQVYISRARMEAFSLIADSSYISQNCSRICRALFELCLRRGWRVSLRLFSRVQDGGPTRVAPSTHLEAVRNHAVSRDTV